jgi:4-hydroxybenzoate polyprenyltransferase
MSVVLFLHFRHSEPKAGIYLFSLYALGILFITPMSETHHLIYVLPAVSILIYELTVNKRYNDLLLFIGSVLFAVLFWTGAVLKGGPYHFSALLILFILTIIEMKKKVNDSKSADQV